MKLFTHLQETNAYNEWAPLLEWLFNDHRFDGFSSGHVGNLTKKIQRLPRMNDKNCICSSIKKLTFPDNATTVPFQILAGEMESEARDIVRHIRNGIAHGHVIVVTIDGEVFIEIKDYTKDKRQSAYICIPLSYIESIYRFYHEIKKKIDGSESRPKRQNSRKKAKKAPVTV